jgi:hypothetical protein
MNQPTESDEFLLLPFVENYYFEGGMTGCFPAGLGKPLGAARLRRIYTAGPGARFTHD